MIKTKKGRRNSVRTDDERLRLLKEEIQGLPPQARRLLQATMLEMGNSDSSLIEAMAEQRWVRQPVSVAQFIDDPYYLGGSTETLYPKVRQDLITALGTHAYREMVLTGSIGWGKTTFLSIAICRMLYELSCLRNPQVAYQLSPGSELVIAVISKNLHLARTVMKSSVEDKLGLSPYFSENFKPRVGRDVTKFPSGIMFTIGSCNSERILGMNVIGGALDEANFMASKGEVIKSTGKKGKTVAQFDLAEKTYASICRRIKSRFLRAAPDLPGAMILASSAATIGSFTDRKLKASKDDPTVFSRDYATWEVKPASTFCGETFPVVVGSGAIRSKILDNETASRRQFFIDQGCEVINVPVEYTEDFERDLENAIRDIAGIGTHAISAFIHRVDKVQECVDPSLKHPFSVEEYDSGGHGHFLWELMVHRKTRRLPGGHKEHYFVPKLNPTKPRHIHIDTSLSGDSTGIAMGHVERWVEVVRRSEDGTEYADMAPFFAIDFVLRINPPYGEQIFLPDVRRLVYELHEHGFHIGGFSCDQYQSAEMLQQVKTRGIPTKLLSVDRTVQPYERLKSAIYENRVRYYNYPPFLRELKALEYDRVRGKVDHPIAGTKDVSDSVAGVIEGLNANALRAPVGMPADAPRSAESQGWITGGKIPWSPGKELPVRAEGCTFLPVITG